MDNQEQASQRGSCLYQGAVLHRRLRPKHHRLSYRVFSLVLDLDELESLDRDLRSFSWNRAGLVSFYDKDHGPGDGSPLKPYVVAELSKAGIDLGPKGRVRLLCYPRILGYVFNPLCVYYCEDGAGQLKAILYEVTNTYGERHSYLIPADANTIGKDGLLRQSCPKGFYVSPFIGMTATYHFRLTPLVEKMALSIHQTDPDGPLLHASFVGRRKPLTDRTLLRAFVSHPLMTVKVVMGIYWEALKLWLKGVPIFDHPAPPEKSVTIQTTPPA